MAKIVTILPCSWLRLLLRSLVIAGLDIVEQVPRVRPYDSEWSKQPMARGGPASRSLVPGIAAACPFGPPALQKPVLPRHFCSRSRSMDLSTLRFSPSSLHFPVRVFPDRTGPGPPTPATAVDRVCQCGKGPATVQSTAAVRQGSAVQTQSPAASPRLRHRSPCLVRQPPPCSPSGLVVPLSAAAGSRTLPSQRTRCRRHPINRASLRPSVR